jgi:oligopeptide/dipeptide ABC transporter ATP-binding protein
MNESAPVLAVRDLSVTYSRAGKETRAAEGVDLEVYESEIVGLVGESGCGKSTVAMSLIGLLPGNARIDGGQILIHGEDFSGASEESWRRVRWSEISVVFQGGMNALNPLRQIVDQIIEPILVHERGVSTRAARARAIELLMKVGIAPERATAYPHELSGGMRQRAGIAMALACQPRLIVADEPVTALDVVVQAQILSLLSDLREGLGLAMVFISHDLGVVARLCDRVAVMYAANIVEQGSAREVFRDTKHPYTLGLVESTPRIGGARGVGAGLTGTPPSLVSPPSGCRFHPRCKSVMPQCVAIRPQPTTFSATHSAECHLYDSG